MAGVLLVFYWSTAGVLLVFYWSTAGVLLVFYWSTAGVLLVFYWSTAGVLLVFYWSTAEDGSWYAGSADNPGSFAAEPFLLSDCCCAFNPPTHLSTVQRMAAEDGSWYAGSADNQSGIKMVCDSNDCTGGMSKKVEEAACIALTGIDVVIAQAGSEDAELACSLSSQELRELMKPVAYDPRYTPSPKWRQRPMTVSHPLHDEAPLSQSSSHDDEIEDSRILWQRTVAHPLHGVAPMSQSSSHDEEIEDSSILWQRTVAHPLHGVAPMSQRSSHDEEIEDSSILWQRTVAHPLHGVAPLSQSSSHDDDMEYS
eukprot:gene18683-25203_t